jgi:DNA polymerase-3 subunit delta'
VTNEEPQTDWPQPYPWQDGAVREWLADRQRWPHAWLLHGPRGYGKRTLALHLAASLLCESPREGQACGACASCHWFGQRQHPDFRLLEPAADEEESDKAPPTVIKIDQVRALTEFLQLSTHRQGAKVAVVEPAEALNPSAANALLKTLEEPPPGSYLLLVSHAPRRLPATLRSRCRSVAAPRPGGEIARQWLQGRGSRDPALHLAQAGGSPLRAIACGEPSWQEGRRFLLEALARPRTLSAVGMGARLDAVPKAVRKEALQRWCDWLASWVHDLASVAAGGEPRFNPDFAEPLRRLAKEAQPLALQRFYRTLLEQRGLLLHPLQPRLIVEMLLLQYRDALGGEARGR